MATRRRPTALSSNGATARALRTDMGQIGQTGLVRFGYGGTGPQGQRVYEEWLQQIQGPQGRRIYREMQDNDPIIGAILFCLEMLIRQIDWHVTPKSDVDADRMLAEFIDGALHDMRVTWQDTLSEVLSFLPWGFSYHEILFKRRQGEGITSMVDGVPQTTPHSKFDDGRLGWDAWSIRGQETLDRWEFDPHGRTLGMWQLGPPDYVFHYIPLEKALLFRTTTKKDNPEGRSILRNSYVPWYRKKHIEEIEGIGIERDLAGLPVAHVPPELLLPEPSAQDLASYTAINTIVTNIRRDSQEGIVWPLAYDENGKEMYKLELLHTGGTRQFDTDKIIQRYDTRIAMTVMADFLTLGHEQRGTQALAQQKGKFFSKALEAWADSICAQVNDRAIPQLLRLNGMPSDRAPKLEHGEVEGLDVGVLGTFLQALALAGLPLDNSPDGALITRLMELAGLPKPEPPKPGTPEQKPPDPETPPQPKPPTTPLPDKAPPAQPARKKAT